MEANEHLGKIVLTLSRRDCFKSGTIHDNSLLRMSGACASDRVFNVA